VHSFHPRQIRLSQHVPKVRGCGGLLSGGDRAPIGREADRDGESRPDMSLPQAARGVVNLWPGVYGYRDRGAIRTLYPHANRIYLRLGGSSSPMSGKSCASRSGRRCLPGGGGFPAPQDPPHGHREQDQDEGMTTAVRACMGRAPSWRSGQGPASVSSQHVPAPP
jgi:hypothetical protein